MMRRCPLSISCILMQNNLYGLAMSQYLPTGNFKWMTDKEISKTNLGKYELDSKEGLILEVDLEYPKELHDLHNDYPIAPEKVKVSNDMLSAYCKKIAKKYNISTGLVSKLIPTLRDKKEYILHYRNLQLCLDLGLKIKKSIKCYNLINPLGLSNISTSTLRKENMPKIHLKRTSLS